MNLQQSSDFEMTASAGEGFRPFHSLGRANKCNLTTSSLFRFSGLIKHIVTGIEHEPSKEEVLEQT